MRHIACTVLARDDAGDATCSGVSEAFFPAAATTVAGIDGGSDRQTRRSPRNDGRSRPLEDDVIEQYQQEHEPLIEVAQGFSICRRRIHRRSELMLITVAPRRARAGLTK